MKPMKVQPENQNRELGLRNGPYGPTKCPAGIGCTFLSPGTPFWVSDCTFMGLAP